MKKFMISTVLLIPLIFLEAQIVLNPAIESKIDALLAKMTLEEKLGQMAILDGSNPDHDELIEQGKLGALLNVVGAAETNRLQELAVKRSRLGIPLLMGLDVIHGYRTIFPIPLASACSWDTALIKQSARIAAIEARSEGVNWTFAPMVDIARDPRWGRIAEGAGEDPFLGSIIAATYVKGYQDGFRRNNESILACAKHYVAYRGAEAGRDYNTVDISERTLREIYLPPFKAVVNAGVGSIMSAFNEIGGVPATANSFTLRTILKGEWGFKGFVVSDYNAIGELINHGIADNRRTAAYLALQAGVDMDMEGKCFNFELLDLVKTGKVPESWVDEAVRRVLRMKFQLGLFENPYTDPEWSKKVILNPEHVQLARKLAQRSIVLLKNKDSVLPLDLKKYKKIAVIGPLADDKEAPLGSWSCQGKPKDVVTIWAALQNRVNNIELLFAKGCGIRDSDKSGFNKALEIAKQADLILLVLGESADMSGEAASRSNLELPGVQSELIQYIAETRKPIVLILINGRPLVLTKIEPFASAILESWQLGIQHGNAVVDVLLGEVNPSGKLAATFPRDLGQVPIYYNHKNTGRPGNKYNKYTSKYIDIDNAPLYPFGWGLSYTTFKYSNLKVLKNKVTRKDDLVVEVEVENTGSRAGIEVVQLYIRDLVASVTRPVKELKGFRTVELAPKEKKVVSFKIPVNEFGFYNKSMQYVVEPGKFLVMVGGNSVDLMTAEFEVVE